LNGRKPAVFVKHSRYSWSGVIGTLLSFGLSTFFQMKAATKQPRPNTSSHSTFR